MVICEICSKKTNQCCKTCNQARYCSKTCQKKDRSIHRLLCYEAKSYSDNHRPASPDPKTVYRRAIFLYAVYSWPEFVWVEMRLHNFKSRESLVWLPTLEPFGMTPQGIAVDAIGKNLRTRRALSPYIKISYLKNFLNDGSSTNKITDILSADRAEDGSANWRGPILFVGKYGVDQEPLALSSDLQVSDLRHIVDWMQCLKKSFKELQYLVDRGYPGAAECLDERPGRIQVKRR
jgi:hypothetical protein